MNTQRVLATFMVAILAASAFSVVAISSPLQRASAQSAVTIETSADDHGNTFFGGMVQVVIEDPTADDDGSDTIEVDVDLDSTDGDNTQTITVPDTNDGSQRFEFFIVHTDAADKTPADPETDGTLSDDQILEFGDGAGTDELPVTALELYDDASFDITVGDTEVTIDYEESTGVLEIDRTTYGSTSKIHLFIVDQDGNIDPTTSNNFNVTAADLNTGLFTINGALFNDTVQFLETGDNSARFEAELQLDETPSASDLDELDFTSESIQMTLNDMANYDDAGFNNAENDSTDTDDISFDIDDVDGAIDELGTVTFASELKVTVRDNDQNVDSEDDDTIANGLVVSVPGGDSVTVDLEETEDNSGVFVPDTTNNEIKIAFANSGTPSTTDDILTLTPSTTTEDITVAYADPLNDDSDPETFDTTIELALSTPQVDLPETAGINDDFTLQITDANLNDNPRTRDSYTFTLSGTGAEALFLGTSTLSNLATIEFEIEGDAPTFATSLPYTLVETGINTGIFTTELDMADLIDSSGQDVEDGDTIEVTFIDFFDDQSREASDEVAIGKASLGVDFSRTVLPIPVEEDTDWDEVLDNLNSFTTLLITDADQNEQSNTEDSFEFCFLDDVGATNSNATLQAEIDAHCPEGSPGFTVEFDGDEIASEDDYFGSDLESVLPGLAEDLDDTADEGHLTLTETGKTTGVFDEELEFEFGDLTADDWQDLEITFNYFDAEDDDDESAGITFRGNDGQLTVDQDSAKTGTTITVTVQDEDLNLDDDTAEEFDASVGTSDPFIVSLETEDDEVENTHTETFRETGPDTGIFTAEYLVGTDIDITEEDGGELNQATNILITYNDQVDSTGDNGEEIEFNVPIVTGTGSIQVTPELVGPGTELTVLIIDSDLDKDARATETYPEDSDDLDDFFVEFRSDRSEVSEASPEIEETGPNTGVFSFTLELVTDETACENDDLVDGDIDLSAEEGSNPSIGACPGDLISIRYEDEQAADGRSTTVSQVVEVRSWDPEFQADNQSYAVGDRVSITIADPDANRDPDIADSLTDIRVFSTSDQVGEELSALETGKSTGVFRLTFTVSDDTASGSINVKQGDRVTIEYEDEYPADFQDEEEDKDFQFTITIAGKTGTDATTPSSPALKDVTGRTLSSLQVGQQAVLSTSINNNNDEARPFVALVEVRDSDGITVFLAWQTGTLNPNGQAEVGLSWTPEEAGDYEVRTFVVSDLQNPQVLSLVKTSNISVSG